MDKLAAYRYFRGVHADDLLWTKHDGNGPPQAVVDAGRDEVRFRQRGGRIGYGPASSVRSRKAWYRGALHPRCDIVGYYFTKDDTV